MENQKTRKRGQWARLIIVTLGTLFVGVAALGSPAGAETTSEQEAESVQTEAVESDTPVMVSDLEISPQAVTETYYCAVRDGTFGCQQGQPGDGLVVARLYQHPDYNRNRDGWQIVIYNPAYQVGCTGRYTDNEGGANLGSTLDNAVSSAHTYNSCDVKLFAGNNKTGDASRWIDHDNNIGALDNRANSFRIS